LDSRINGLSESFKEKELLYLEALSIGGTEGRRAGV